MDASTAMLRAVFMAYLASLYVIDKQAVDELRAFETIISSFRGSVRIRNARIDPNSMMPRYCAAVRRVEALNA